MVNVSGVGVLNRRAPTRTSGLSSTTCSAPRRRPTSPSRLFEYPVVTGVPTPAYVPPLAELKPPAIDLNDLDSLATSIAMITEAGLTS